MYVDTLFLREIGSHLGSSKRDDISERPSVGKAAGRGGSVDVLARRVPTCKSRFYLGTEILTATMSSMVVVLVPETPVRLVVDGR